MAKRRWVGDPEPTGPHAFIQWKGTNVCMDVYCKCGAHLHIDDDFVYSVQCPHCDQVWLVGCHVELFDPAEVEQEYHKDTAKLLSPDCRECSMSPCEHTGYWEAADRPHPIGPVEEWPAKAIDVMLDAFEKK